MIVKRWNGCGSMMEWISLEIKSDYQLMNLLLEKVLLLARIFCILTADILHNIFYLNKPASG